MISEENNEELRPPEQQGSDEPVADEISVDNDGPDVMKHSDDESTGPGQLLSRKREALGMTLQQVADELHITMHYVRALESNAYDKLPGDVFIRGYIRSYANLLKLDPVVLTNVYNEFTNHQESSAVEAASGRSRRRRNRNTPWIIVSGVAFVVIAFALWYLNARSSAPASGSVQGNSNSSPARVVVPAPALSDGSTPTIDNVATTLATDVITTETSVTPAVTSSIADSAVNATPAAIPAAVTAVLESAEEVIGAAQNDLSRQAQTAEGSVQEVAVSAAATSGLRTELLPSESDVPASGVLDTSTARPAGLPALTESRVISVDAGGEDLVQITFNGESMVQVEDSNDKQIYRDIRTSGDVLRITGSAPFNILLGDAAATELSLNGNKIDFTSNIRVDNSVRLTIGL